MRDRKLAALRVALAVAMPLLMAGCGKEDAPLPVAAAAPAPAPAPAPAVGPAAALGTQIDDGVVTAKVKSALFADPDLASFNLKVETFKGTVQLSGFVDSQAQIERALAAARAVEGVGTVENKVVVKETSRSAGEALDDGVITARVKAALLADPDVKGLDINVMTRKGEVQLSGFVESQLQIDQALGLARKVDGVASVGNEMSLKQ